MFKEKIIIEMKEVFKEIPFGIEHTLKVLKNAEDIMKGENIGEEEKEFISIIAILHDIGAVEAQKKYGSIDGVYQEKEGPEVAKEILKKVGQEDKRSCVQQQLIKQKIFTLDEPLIMNALMVIRQ